MAVTVSDSCPVANDEAYVDDVLNVAREAAVKAGRFLLRKQKRGIHVISEKTSRDELLDADLEAEKIIIEHVRSAFPRHDILSEESETCRQFSPYQWIIDPLDGSFNFQHGSPTFGVTISFLIQQVPVIGVIYLPFYRELFTAVRGKKASLNGEEIAVSQTADLPHAVVHVGDFAKDGCIVKNEERLHDISHLANSVGRVRMIGTAATDLAYIACGRADALVVHNVLPWDSKAGALLIQEAGGVVIEHENPAGQKLMICSNKRIYGKLMDVLCAVQFADPEYGSATCELPTSKRS